MKNIITTNGNLEALKYQLYFNKPSFNKALKLLLST